MHWAMRHKTHFIDVTQSWHNRLRFRVGLIAAVATLWTSAAAALVCVTPTSKRTASCSCLRDLPLLVYSDNPKLSVVDSFGELPLYAVQELRCRILDLCQAAQSHSLVSGLGSSCNLQARFWHPESLEACKSVQASLSRKV